MAPKDMTIEPSGIREFTRRFSLIDKRVMREGSDAMERSVATIHADAAGYSQYDPPQRPNQTYVRVFTLAKSMSHNVATRPGQILGYVRAGAEYSIYVMGVPQHPVFAGRWYTLEGKALEHVGDINRYFAKAMDDIAKHLAD